MRFSLASFLTSGSVEDGSSETRMSWTGPSKPLHLRSHIWTLPSRLEVAITLSLLPGWKRTCFTEDTCPAIVKVVRWVGISMIRALWSPDAVANSMSLEEKDKSRMALWCGRKLRYAVENPGFPSLADSSSRTPPSSSPMATSEFATIVLFSTNSVDQRKRAALLLQLTVQKGRARSCIQRWVSSGLL